LTKHRFIKFWFQDWMRDPALRGCSLAARGLWIDLLAVATAEGDGRAARPRAKSLGRGFLGAV
jgi:hypothetical protein